MTVSTTDRVPVRFAGEGGGVEELSWGQREIWTAMCRQRSWMPAGAVTSLPTGMTVDDLVAESRFFMSRYQTARTRLRFDADGAVKQVVADAGETALDIVDAAPDADPAAVAARLKARYEETDYDFVAQWPVRMGVVRHRGVPTHKVVVMCHLVTDGAGGVRMARELTDWRRARFGTGEPVGPLTAPQPMAQAQWQRGAAGQRVNEAALRYWARILRRVPPRRFPGAGAPHAPRHWLGEFDSPAMWLALRVLAERLRASTASLLLTVYGISLASLTGIHPVVVQVVTDNRFRSGLSGSVGPASQTGLCVLDVAGATVAEAVARVRRETMIAFKYAYYDPVQMADLIDRISHERGEDIDINSYFNDRRLVVARESAEPAPAPERVGAALAHSAFQWRQRGHKPFEHLFVHVEDRPDRIGLTVAGDTQLLTPADMEECVRGMERLAVAAAQDPAAPVRSGVAG